MSDVINSVLKLAFGLIINKLRTYGAKKLENGGLTNQKFRNWIIDELHDVNSKLDGISKKNLLSGISFVQEGFKRLNLALSKSVERGDTGASSTNTEPARTMEDAVRLARAFGNLIPNSVELLEKAKDSFKEAGKQATLAFHNTTLSTEERILSSKVRIASSILEHLDHTEVAVSDCLHYLEELHNLPAIQEIFSVYIEGGMKSLFKKTSRAEIVETVTMINLILAEFISKFTNKRMAVFDWPQMKCGEQSVHLIHCKEESVAKMRKIEITPPWNIVECGLNICDCAINNNGDMISFCYEDNNIYKLDREAGKWQLFLPLDDEISGRKCIAITDEHTVYIVSKVDDLERSIPRLSAYSSDRELIYSRTLDFIREGPCSIAITNDNKIVICCDDNTQVVVYVCDNSGKREEKFVKQLKDWEVLVGLFVTWDNEIAVAVKWYDKFKAKDVVNFDVYSGRGKWRSAFKLKQQSSDLYVNITLDHAMKSYTVCSRSIYDTESNIIYIESISQASRFVRNPVILDGNKYNIGGENCKFISHKNSAMAFVSPERVFYLQSSSN